jgi:hypothetical protein
MTLVIFSSILFSFGFVIYHEIVSTDMHYVNYDNYKSLYLLYGNSYGKQHNYNSDSFTILAYIAFIIGIVAPNIQQIE